MDTLKLGQIIEPGRTAERDAFHVAVVPVVAFERLHPGQWVGIRPDGAAGVGALSIGLVDPFLRNPVYPGQRFWLWMTPGSITSLRHDWTHPAFDDDATANDDDTDKETARRWIENHAAELDLTFNALMEAATLWITDQEYTTQQGSKWWRDTFRATEFWEHYETMTGTKVKSKEAFFSCLC